MASTAATSTGRIRPSRPKSPALALPPPPCCTSHEPQLADCCLRTGHLLDGNVPIQLALNEGALSDASKGIARAFNLVLFRASVWSHWRPHERKLAGLHETLHETTLLGREKRSAL